MKIKTKKQLNLPQLIEWAWDNGVRDKIYYDEVNANSAEFDIYGEVLLEGEISKTDLYTVEVEEEITEDTVIPKMVEIYLDNERDIPYSQIHYNQTINQAINTQECGSKTLTFHKMEDDGTHTLIWRNGTLVKEE